MDSVRSRTSAAYRVASRAGPSPRAAGAPFQSGAAIPAVSTATAPKTAGSYTSLQPLGVRPRPSSPTALK